MSEVGGPASGSVFGDDSRKAYGAIASSVLKEMQGGRSRDPGAVILSEKLGAQQEIIENQARQIDVMKRELELQTSEVMRYRTEFSGKCDEFAVNVSDVLKVVAEFMVNCNQKYDGFVSKIGLVGGRIADLAEENARMKKEIEDLTRKLSENMQSISAHSEESAILLAQIEAKNKECRALQEESEKWRMEKEKMQEQVEESEERMAEMAKAVEAAKRERDDLERSVQELKRREQENEVMMRVSNQATEEVKTKLEESERQIGALMEQLKISKATEESLQAQIEEQKAAFGNAQKSGDQLANELMQLQSKKSALEAENLETKIALESANERANGLKEQVEKANEKVSEQQDIIETLRIEKSRLMDNIESQNNKMAEMRDEHMNAVLKLKEEIQDRDEEIERRKDEIEKMMAEKQSIVEEMQNNEGNYSKNQEEMELRCKEVEARNEHLEKEKMSAEREKVAAQRLADSLQVKVRELEDTVNSNFAEIDRLNQIHQTLKVEGNDLRLENERLTREVKHNEELNRAKSESVNNLESEVETLKRRIELMNVEIQNKQMENELLTKSGQSESQLKEEVIALRSQLNLVNDEKESLTRKMQDYHQLQSRVKAQEMALEKTELISNNLKIVTAEKDVLKAERQELLSIAGAFNMEIFDLKDHFMQLESENRRMKQEVARLIAINEENEANLSALEQAKSTVDDNLEAMKTRNSSINQVLSKENEDLRSRITAMKEEFERAQEQLNSLKKEVRMKESMVNEMKSEMATMQRQLMDPSEMNKLSERVKILTEENAKKFAQIEFLTKKLDKIQEENDILHQTVHTSEEQTTQISRLAEEVRLLGSEKLEMLEIIGPLNSEIYDIRQELAEFGKKYREAKHEATTLRMETQRLASENVVLKSSLDAAEAHYARVCTEIETKEEELTFLRKSTNESTEDLKKEIVAVYSELNERRQRDGVNRQTEMERDLLLKDISALELHIYNLELSRDDQAAKNHQLLQPLSLARTKKLRHLLHSLMSKSSKGSSGLQPQRRRCS